jgi:hypothetical protein
MLEGFFSEYLILKSVVIGAHNHLFILRLKLTTMFVFLTVVSNFITTIIEIVFKLIHALDIDYEK